MTLNKKKLIEKKSKKKKIKNKKQSKTLLQ
jgi:hypothetical protein